MQCRPYLPEAFHLESHRSRKILLCSGQGQLGLHIAQAGMQVNNLRPENTQRFAAVYRVFVEAPELGLIEGRLETARQQRKFQKVDDFARGGPTQNGHAQRHKAGLLLHLATQNSSPQNDLLQRQCVEVNHVAEVRRAS